MRVYLALRCGTCPGWGLVISNERGWFADRRARDQALRRGACPGRRSDRWQGTSQLADEVCAFRRRSPGILAGGEVRCWLASAPHSPSGPAIELGLLGFAGAESGLEQVTQRAEAALGLELGAILFVRAALFVLFEAAQAELGFA